MIGFGIDLAGYTTGRTSVAAIEVESRFATVTLLRRSHLSDRHSSDSRAKEVICGDAKCLQRCLNLGPVAVDVPIDLQGLPNHSNLTAIWALTLRPIDKKLGAMPPFADRIGALVARFAAMMRFGELADDLGCRLFETYPAATWKKLQIKAGNYKAKKGKEARLALCDRLNIRPQIDNDNDIDAVICAVTAAAPAKYICVKDDLALDIGELPCGFRILKKMPFKSIRVTSDNFDEWLTIREKSK